MKNNRLLGMVLILCAIFMFCVGCTGEQTDGDGAQSTVPEWNENGQNKVTLLVTKDFGSELLVEKQVDIEKGWTVLEVMEANLETATKQDGIFVNGINGLESKNGGISGKRLDWFYYINGVCADVGAGDYEVRPGEVIWWDYHTWKNMGSANSAVIGCYPEPFLHGYRGKIGEVVVMTSEKNLSLANEIQQALKNQGVNCVIKQEIVEDMLADRTGSTIVLGEWNNLKEITWLNKLNKAYQKNGTSIHFTDDNLELLTYNGEVGRIITGSAGVLVATGEGLGDNSPLWLMIGTDSEGLRQTVNKFVNNADEFSRVYNAAVVSDNLVRLPLQE